MESKQQSAGVAHLLGVALLALALVSFSAQGIPFLLGDGPAVRGAGGKLTDALDAVAKGDYALASEEVRSVLDDEPSNAVAWELRGLIEASQDRLTAAEDALRKSLSIDSARVGAWNKLAIIYIHQERDEDADNAIQAALELEPSNRLANTNAARLSVRQGDVGKAFVHYRAALDDLPPPFRPLHFEAASYFETRGEYQKVIELIRPVLDAGGDHPEARFLLASALLGLNQVSAARQHVQALEAMAPAHRRLPLLRGITLRLEGNGPNSVKALREVLRDDPDDRVTRFHLGLSLASAGDWRSALDELTPLATPTDALPVHLAIARIRLVNGQVDEAITGLERIQETYSQPAALLALGQAHLIAASRAGLASATGKSHGQKALSASDELVAAHETFVPGHLLRVQSLAALGRRSDALRGGVEVTQRFPGEPSTWQTLAALYSADGKPEKAIDALRQGIEHNSGSAQLHFQLAVAHHREGRLEHAETQYRAVIARVPRHLLALNNLASVLGQRGDPSRLDEGVQLAERAYAISPSNADVLDTLGYLLHRVGDHDRAVALLEEATARAKDSPAPLCHLGLAYQAQGRRSDAKQAIDRCLALEPSARLAEQAREALSAD